MWLGRRRRALVSAGGGGGAVTDPGVTAINATGWDATFTSPPTMDPVGSPKYVYATRQGFSATGGATSFTDALIITQRVAQAFPNQASLDASRVALSDYVYSTDTVTGVTNSSGETSPKPVCNWALPDRQTVGNTLHLEVVASHRDARSGEQVACVEFTVTDGSTTVTQKVSASSILGHAGDVNAVIGYAADVDVSSLSSGTLTANAKVYPIVGTSGSVADSSTGAANSRDFCPQVYVKNTIKAATPSIAVVSTTGVDATGVVSTSEATATATPFLTVQGAIAGLRAQVAGSIIDGCEVRLTAGTFVFGAVTFATYQSAAEVIITRHSGATRANAILQFGAGSSPATRLNWLRCKDITLDRQGLFSLTLANKWVLENCTFANNSNNALWIAGTCSGYMLGVTITGGTALLLSAGTQEQRLFRGVTYGSSGSGFQMENWIVLGCSLQGVLWREGSRSVSGSITAFTKNMSCSGSSIPWQPGATDINGAVFSQNVVEWIGTALTASFRPSGDSAAGNVTHLVAHNNTFAGFGAYGRGNILYNETNAVQRTHKLCSLKGNIHVQINTKHDVFYGVNGNGTPNADGNASLKVGGWSYLYGVGCYGEFSQFLDAGNTGIGGFFAQMFPGLNASIGTSATVRNDPLFTAPAATTSGPTVGAGNGTYTVGSSSPCKSRAQKVLKWDLAGTARNTTTTSGAYEAA